MNRVASTVAQLGHVCTRQQLTIRGFTGVDIAAAVHAGAISRIRRGWFATPEATGDQRDAVYIGGRMSHATAARSYGLWAGLDSALHVSVTRGASRLRAVDRDVRLHWIRPGRQDLTSNNTWRVDLDECLRGVVASASAEDSIACLDSALHVLALSAADLSVMFSDAPAVSRARCALARPGSESGLESIVRQRLLRLGVRFRQQVVIAGVGRVDFVVGRRLVVEIDGREYHEGSTKFESDRWRLARLVEREYTVLQFSYRRVMFDWPSVARVIFTAAARVG